MSVKLKTIVTLIVFLFPYFIPSNTYSVPLSWHLSYSEPHESTSINISNGVIFASIRHINDFDLLKSTNNGNSWTSIKPGLPPGQDANWISIQKDNPSRLAISLWGSGVFVSTNSGTSWFKIFSSSTPRAVELDPDDNNTIFVGIGGDHDSNSGLYRTKNGGNTWTKLGPLNDNNAQITIDSTNPNTIFADSDPYYYRSTNGGDDWTLLPLQHVYTNAIIDKDDHTTIYTSRYDSNISGVFKSTDSGDNWAIKNNGFSGPPFRLTQDDDGTLYASRFANGVGGVWRSTDGAETWEDVSDPAWGGAHTWGLDAKDGQIFVGVEGFGIYHADTNIVPPPPPEPNPVVFVPGFGGSYSTKGLLLNLPTTYKDWTLTHDFVDVYYNPLINTLKDAGLTENQKLFIFGYDYRKSITDNAVSLNSFLTNEVLPKNPGKKINIVGHSMGGLVIRQCFEKVVGCNGKIGKIVTAGTPHSGTVDAYYFWEGGEINEKDLMLKTAEKLLLHLNKATSLTKTKIVQTNIPGARDILPIFDYIDNKPYSQMSTIGKNPNLKSLFPPSPAFLASTTTLAGDIVKTKMSLTVKNPSIVDQVLGIWRDGQPKKFLSNEGDDTILKSSALLSGAGNAVFGVHHQAYFQDPTARELILNLFDLPLNPPLALKVAQENITSVGVVYSKNNDLLSAEDVPATENSIVFLKNPKKKDFKVKLKGTKGKDYSVTALYVDLTSSKVKSKTGKIGTTGSLDLDTSSFAVEPTID